MVLADQVLDGVSRKAQLWEYGDAGALLRAFLCREDCLFGVSATVGQVDWQTHGRDARESVIVNRLFCQSHLGLLSAQTTVIAWVAIASSSFVGTTITRQTEPLCEMVMG